MMKKINILIIVIAIYTQLILLGVAYAQTCIGGGALTITAVPSTINFPEVAASFEDQTNNMSFSSSLNFQDMRGDLLGFVLDVTATNFVNAADGDSFSVTNLKIVSDSDDTITEVECDTSTGITLNHLEFSAFTDNDSDGISDSETIVTGSILERIGSYSIDPELQLTVPGGTSGGNYKSTLTFTII